MFVFKIIFIFIVSQIMLNAQEIRSFSSYEQAIEYIKYTNNIENKKEEKNNIPNNYKPKKKRTLQTNTTKETNFRQNVRKFKKASSSCKTPKIYIQEYLTKLETFNTFGSNINIKYKYIKTNEKNQEFFIVLHNFPYDRKNNIILNDKKRFLIKHNFSPSRHKNKKITNIDGAKRLQVSVSKRRNDHMYIVYETDKQINGCELYLFKQDNSQIIKYSQTKARQDKYDILYKISIGG